MAIAIAERPTATETTERAVTPERQLRRYYPVPSAEAFRDPEWEPPAGMDPDDEDDLWPKLDFLPADDVRRLAERLIEQNESFRHLRDMRLEYRWKREGGKSKGKATLGKCIKATGLLRHFTQFDFVIWLAADHARDAFMTYRQVEALVFHELCHAGRDEQGRPSVEAHDFEGFGKELQVYGAWTSDLRIAERAFQQLRLDLGDE